MEIWEKNRGDSGSQTRRRGLRRRPTPPRDYSSHASGGAFVGAAEKNIIFPRRDSGFAAGAARRDTAMNRASARTGARTKKSACKRGIKKLTSARREANRGLNCKKNSATGMMMDKFIRKY